MNYKCNQCKEAFTEQHIILKTEKQGNGIEQIYYNCPKCGFRYNVCKTSQETRKIQLEIKAKALLIKNKLAKGGNTLKDSAQLNKLISKYKIVMNKLNGE